MECNGSVEVGLSLSGFQLLLFLKSGREKPAKVTIGTSVSEIVSIIRIQKLRGT